MVRLTLCLLSLVLLVPAARGQQVAITFDDLPAHGPRPHDFTRIQIAKTILAALKAENMPPVYGFINGKDVEDERSTEQVLSAWRAAGNPLGNHTWEHSDLEAETPEAFELDATKDEPLLKKHMAGEDWHWFRYPYLHEGETVEKRRAVRAWLTEHDYKIAEVNMDFEDYLWNEPYARCVKRNDTAAITRLHDTYLATAEQYITFWRELSQKIYGRDVKYILLMHVGAFDARMLPELLKLYRSRGFSFITLQEAEADPAYGDDPDAGYKGGGALLEQVMAARGIKFPPNTKPYKELDSMCRSRIP